MGLKSPPALHTVRLIRSSRVDSEVTRPSCWQVSQIVVSWCRISMSRLHRIGKSSDAPRVDVIFIHGLGGDAFGTWRFGTDEESSWPHWLAADAPEAAVWSLGYAASPTILARLLRIVRRGDRDSGYAMALPDRARQVLDALVLDGLGDRPLILIGHSLGGLLAKQILRAACDERGDERKNRIFQSARAVLFAGTPHAGSLLATCLHELRLVFGSTASIEDLRAGDSHQRDLSAWYRKNWLY